MFFFYQHSSQCSIKTKFSLKLNKNSLFPGLTVFMSTRNLFIFGRKFFSCALCPLARDCRVMIPSKCRRHFFEKKHSDNLVTRRLHSRDTSELMSSSRSNNSLKKVCLPRRVKGNRYDASILRPSKPIN